MFIYSTLAIDLNSNNIENMFIPNTLMDGLMLKSNIFKA